jgi:UDP-N-acetylmuramyl pentapeptide phosphotransferase/UDP-N-acetylglucosamine-1-phosphate transferase
MKVFVVLVLSFVLGNTGAWVVAKYGKHFGLIDNPDERSSHLISTPKGGGIGILAAFFLICVAFRISVFFWLPAVVLSLLSLLGDRVEISQRFRLAFHFLLTGLFLYNISKPNFFGVVFVGYRPKWLELVLISLFFLLFIVGTANFFNFMDGINGIAGISGAMAFGFLGVISWQRNDPEALMILSFGLAIACIGFLIWNFVNAKVFMGDVGSILLGFVFAGLVVKLSDNIKDLACYSGFLFLFYSDELTTMIERIKKKESLILAHRRHLYQVLANEGGISHWKVSVGYGLIQLLISSSLLFIEDLGMYSVFLLLTVLFIIFAGSSHYIKKRFEVCI